MRSNLTKIQVVNEKRHSEQIDVSVEPDLYFALQAWEYHGNAIRDNSIEDWIKIGKDIELGEDEILI